MSEPPPPIILPDHWVAKQPALIRAEVDPLRYFPIWISRPERRAALADLRRSGRILAILPGMFRIATSGGGGPAPVVAATNASNGTSSVQTVNLPAGIVAGDLLVIFVAIGRDQAVGLTGPSGWTQQFNFVGPGNMRRLGCFTKIATGSEASTVQTSVGLNAEYATISYRIIGATGDIVSNIATGTATTADPPPVSPTWLKESLFLGVVSNQAAGSAPTPPSGYSGLLSSARLSGGGNCRVSTAQRAAQVSVEDPGTFALSSSLWHCVATVGIK